MADFVLGLAKAAVEGTVTMAKSAVEEEKKLQKSVQRDLILISDEFEMMHSFLNVTKERVIDGMTTTLVRQVRNTALDVEDCIESVIHLDNRSNWWRRLLPSCMAASEPAAALDEVVADLEFLKARVEAMGQRNIRYSHIGDPGSTPHKQTRQQAAARSKPLDILVEARYPGNKKNSPRDLIQFINGNDDAILQLQVISVWGTRGDLGATSIVKKAYDDPEICKKFACRAWVRLTHPFNPHEFVRSLLAQFCTNYCPRQGSINFMKLTEVMVATEGLLIDEFMRQVSSQRYLIVLEDVSMMVDFEAVRVFLPDMGNGSCIIVHTEQLEIASLCVGQSHRVLELEQFSSEHSICVIFNEDSKEDEEVARRELARKWLHEFQYCGRETNLWLLRSWLKDRGMQVIPVCGIAGVGKSSLVRKVYYETLIGRRCRERFQKFGWVDVSHPFDLRELCWSLLLDLHSGSFRCVSLLRIKDPIHECQKLLRQFRCLIVVNGLRFREEWDLIKADLEGHNDANVIIVIAHEESVARYCSKQKFWLNVEGLEIDEAAALFALTVSKTLGPSSLNEAVMEKAILILLKCGGLPKLIVAVANFVANGRLHDINGENWSALTYRFMEVLEANPAFSGLQDVFAWVHSYFRSCPDFLKPCIFYLSIFPLYHIIRRRRLVRRWIAEGYSRDSKENNAEQNAEENHLQLFLLSMVQVPGQRSLTGYMRMPLCQVNGFLREYIISRSMEDNPVFALKDHCTVNSQHTGRHLTIEETWDRDRIVFQSIDFRRLRSMTVFGEWRSFFISDKMRLLRVLDLEDALGVTDEDLDLMVRLLPRLKFLSLRRCNAVTRLPDSLGGMRHLQTLDIRHTSIVKLPVSITKLQKLQYVRAGTSVPLDDDGISGVQCVSPPPEAATTMTPSSSTLASRFLSSAALMWTCWHERPAGSSNGGVVVPTGIGQLMALHTMGVIDVSVASGQAILEELKDLTQLRKLGVSGVNQENCQELCSAISGHAHLKSLSMRFDQRRGSLYGNPPHLEGLESLKLYGHIEDKLPAWIEQAFLTKLSLQMSMITQELIDVLGDLLFLRTLRLCFKEFKDGDPKFWKCFRELVVLEIAYNSRSQDLTFKFAQDDMDEVEEEEEQNGERREEEPKKREEEGEDEEDEDEKGRGVMEKLELLKLRCFSLSSMWFSGLHNLISLKEVCLSGSYSDALKEHLQSKLPRKTYISYDVEG